MFPTIVGVIDARRSLTQLINAIRTGETRAVAIGRHRTLEALLVSPATYATPEVLAAVTHSTAQTYGRDLIDDRVSPLELVHTLKWLWANDPDTAILLISQILIIGNEGKMAGAIHPIPPTLSQILDCIRQAASEDTDLQEILAALLVEVPLRFDQTGQYGPLLA